MRHIAVLLICMSLWCGIASAKPALPFHAPQVSEISFGLFCAITVTGRSEAAQTTSGWIHLTHETPAFHWPGQRTVPAVIGLAFGVRAQLQTGVVVSDAEMRVFRPGGGASDIWPTAFNDTGGSFAFFRFDTEAELIPGPWVFELWLGETQLYGVEFEVVPAAEGDAIAQACSGTA